MRFASNVDVTNDSDYNLEIYVTGEVHRCVSFNFRTRDLTKKIEEMISSRHNFLKGRCKSISLHRLEYIAIEVFYEKKSVRKDVFVRGGSWRITNASLMIPVTIPAIAVSAAVPTIEDSSNMINNALTNINIILSVSLLYFLLTRKI